ncbi:hypothetical protein BDV98DRAFT_569962 [Pterulicium gracile]|uniref:F-box domain-containing protein n=1 Tax=Pterulicium gracile TaxID=1884261 RepID=A0A5C3QDF6_9AGAR|nr:hypothetical protein BDV98DRAFT_569962 [Pterula gracilis]
MTNPAMHRCLQVLDTQQLICEAILSGSEPHASLAALAVTCKQLCEPALVALWSEMDDVLPLLRLLPEDLFHLVQVCATGGTRKGASGERMHYHYTSAGSFQAPPLYRISRAVKVKDWQRWDLYAPLVKRLTLKFPTQLITHLLEPSTALQLASAALDRSSSLLPCLVKYELEFYPAFGTVDIVLLQLLGMIPGSGLKKLTLKTHHELANTAFLPRILSLRCPSITHLDIVFDMQSTGRANSNASADVELKCAVIDAYAQGITSLREVSHLHLSFIHPSLFSSIASLPRLTSLTLDVTHSVLEPLLPPSSDESPTAPPLLYSSTLEYLHIRARQWTRAMDTLYRIGDTPSLHTLSISTSASAPSSSESTSLTLAINQLLTRSGIESPSRSSIPTLQHCRVDFEYSAGLFHHVEEGRASPLDDLLDSLGNIPHITDLGMRVVLAADVVPARRLLAKIFGPTPGLLLPEEGGRRWKSLRELRLYQRADGVYSLFDVDDVRMLRAWRPWLML